MKIKSIKILNFRLLSNVCVNIEDDITLIVGRNNTGKTSLFEAINIFTKSQEVSFEDFSEDSHKSFITCEKYHSDYLGEINEEKKEGLENLLKNEIPRIQLQLKFEYDIEKDSLINLSEFITDLDLDRHDATVLISFEPKDSLGMFKSFENRTEKNISLIPWLKDNIKNYYQVKCYAVDVESEFNREIDQNFRSKVEKIISFESIKASRTLDDTKSDKNKTLALGFSHYYRERDKGKDDVIELESKLKEVSKNLKDAYKSVLNDVLDDLHKFGVQTPISIPQIEIESEFNSETVIKNNIKYYYKHGRINLPESYNGLGYSNLIYMILEVTTFIVHFENNMEDRRSEILTILIEEPEAHMHPQMQQVFISQITKKINDANKNGISIQLIITTHSSHIVAEAGIDLEKGFDRIRYFNRKNEELKIDDFNTFKCDKEKETFRFLKQYMNLHKCDIFFADKVVMVEGVTEKILLPIMIKKVAPSLNNEYISILEVGGAYTLKFKELLHFIGVKTLIITDLDSVEPKVHGGSCPTILENSVTSNETLKSWIPKETKISELISKKVVDKCDGDFIRVAYQVSEDSQNSYVARSLEGALINKNRCFFQGKFRISNEREDEVEVKSKFDLLRKEDHIADFNIDDLSFTSKDKTQFAFDLMTFDEKESHLEWSVPLYIKEGLEWLADNERK